MIKYKGKIRLKDSVAICSKIARKQLAVIATGGGVVEGK